MSYTVISTFAGCGGSSLGYKWAGFKELLAIEWEDNAVETFKLNFPEVPIWQKDINNVTGKEILEFCNIKYGELDIFDFPVSNQKDVGNHKCPKPLKLFVDLIENYSEDNNTILDLFLGSGTTLIACEQTGRICYGIELEPLYIDVILRRYHKLYPDKEIQCLNREFPFDKLFKEG
ncbi:MAG TPA: DNA methyltransferase [Atribacterota bacterium]|nr:DNA methyltransferase [Atribacterota bacterium]